VAALTDSVRKAFKLTFAPGDEQIFRCSSEAPSARDLNFHEFWRRYGAPAALSALNRLTFLVTIMSDVLVIDILPGEFSYSVHVL
jgi:hypothetical protein